MKKIIIDLKAEDLRKKLNLKDGLNGRDGKDGKDGISPIIDTDNLALKASKLAQVELEKQIPTIPQIVDKVSENIPVLNKEIRDGLELLQGTERLQRTAIDGLDDYEEIARLAREPRKEIKKYYSGGGGGSSVASTYVPYTGATGNVDLGANTLKINETTLTGGTDELTLSSNQLKVGGATGFWPVIYGNRGPKEGLAFYGDTGPDTSYFESLDGDLNFAAGRKTDLSNGVMRFYSYNGDSAVLNLDLLTDEKTFTFPNATGTIALTSDLSGYVPYTGATTNINIGPHNLTTTGTVTAEQLTSTGLTAGYVVKTANYTAVSTDYTIDCTANTFTVTLPTAVGATGRIYNIKNSGTGTITVATTSSQTIDGVTTQTLNQYDSLKIQSTGANFIII